MYYVLDLRSMQAFPCKDLVDATEYLQHRVDQGGDVSFYRVYRDQDSLVITLLP